MGLPSSLPFENQMGEDAEMCYQTKKKIYIPACGFLAPNCVSSLLYLLKSHFSSIWWQVIRCSIFSPKLMIIDCNLYTNHEQSGYLLAKIVALVKSEAGVADQAVELQEILQKRSLL